MSFPCGSCSFGESVAAFAAPALAALFLFALGMRCESKDDKQNIFAAAAEATAKAVVTVAKRPLGDGGGDIPRLLLLNAGTAQR